MLTTFALGVLVYLGLGVAVVAFYSRFRAVEFPVVSVVLWPSYLLGFLFGMVVNCLPQKRRKAWKDWFAKLAGYHG